MNIIAAEKNESLLRVCFFLGVVLTMALFEVLAPRRNGLQKRKSRWPANIGIVVIDTLLVRILTPLTAFQMALWVRAHQIGLFQQEWGIPEGVKLILTILALDCVVYLQHLMFHAVPILWKFHKVHHADRFFDVTTGLRFHPIEIFISLGIKLSAIYVLGANPISVIVFEILLNSTALFNHSNAKIPLGLDRVLRFLVVTPDTHRVHHSVFPVETQSNFGFNFPWWDRMFGTYRDQPEKGHQEMVIGLPEYQEAPVHRLDWVLLGPWL